MEKIKELLNDVFGDPMPYLNALEKTGYLRKDEAFVSTFEDDPISVLFVKKYPLNLASRMGWADYIFYVATSRENRGKGLMGDLLTKTLDSLSARGGDCAVLIPAGRSLFDFYSKFGFETAFYVEQKEFLPVDNGKNIYIPSETDAKAFYPRYFEVYGKRKNTIFKSEEIFYQSVSENLFDTDQAAVLTDGHDFAFASFGEKLILREYVGEDLASFSEAVAEKYGRPVIASVPTDNRDIPLGMIYFYGEKPDLPPFYMDNMLN